MSTDARALAFLLDGPLQAWGVDARFQHRTTKTHPGKSNVLGIVAAAMGLDKHALDEAARLASLAKLRLSTYRIPRGGPRARLIRRLADFHTVGGGFDRKHPVEKLHIARKASGGPSTTLVTRREYLLESRFVAVLEGEPQPLAEIREKLLDPVWGGWLGRKACLPARPFSPLLAADRSTALRLLLEKISSNTNFPLPDDPAAYDRQYEEDGPAAFFQPDQPLAFGSREFRSRNVLHLRPGQPEP